MSRSLVISLFYHRRKSDGKEVWVSSTEVGLYSIMDGAPTLIMKRQCTSVLLNCIRMLVGLYVVDINLARVCEPRTSIEYEKTNIDVISDFNFWWFVITRLYVRNVMLCVVRNINFCWLLCCTDLEQEYLRAQYISSTPGTRFAVLLITTSTTLWFCEGDYL